MSAKVHDALLGNGDMLPSEKGCREAVATLEQSIEALVASCSPEAQESYRHRLRLAGNRQQNSQIISPVPIRN